MNPEDKTDAVRPLTPKFWKFENFSQLFFAQPIISMIWSDVGIGKTTIALQLALDCLRKKQKVFYCYAKESIPQDLIRRIFQNQPENIEENLKLCNPHTFNKQNDIISEWLLEVQQLTEFFHENRVGLIVIDEIASLYLLEMGSDEKNSNLNHKFTYQLATLAQINTKYHIPILLLNSYVTKKDEQENLQDVPHGGKIVDYWTQLEIKMERSPQLAKRICTCMKNLKSFSIPQSWIWLLETRGFT
jgi:RecA/RadA recombinase